MISVKKCNKCEKVKDITHFGKRALNNDGYHNQCKICVNSSVMVRRLKNPDEFRAKRREKYDPLKLKAFYEKNVDMLKDRRRKYFEKNREIVRKKSREYYYKNKPSDERKEKIRIYQKSYRIANRDRINQNRQDRLKSDDMFYLKEAIRSRIKNFIKKGGFKKNFFTRDVLGIEYEGLKKYIERQFLPKMTWNNHGIGDGKWQIDHIIPLSSAKTPDELIILFHYKNLQPLWSIDNIKKGKKILESQTYLAI